MVVSGNFFRTRTRCPWRDLPDGSGNWKTVYNRHRRWSLDGTWEKILDPRPWPARRLPAVHLANAGHPHQPPGHGTAPYPARRRDGRQGLLLGGQPRLPAQARDQGGHPGEGRPEETPSAAAARAAARPPSTPGRYKERNTVERCFAKLKQFRAVATRYDKREFMYQGTVDLASIRI
jgi:transposase